MVEPWQARGLIVSLIADRSVLGACTGLALAVLWLGARGAARPMGRFRGRASAVGPAPREFAGPAGRPEGWSDGDLIAELSRRGRLGLLVAPAAGIESLHSPGGHDRKPVPVQGRKMPGTGSGPPCPRRPNAAGTAQGNPRRGPADGTGARPGRAGTSSDGRLDRRGGRARRRGSRYYESGRLLRERGFPGTPGSERLGRQGRRAELGPCWPGRSRCVQDRAGGPKYRTAPDGASASRGKDGDIQSPARPRPDVFRAQVRISGGAGRRRRAHRRGPRPGGEARARLVRAERRRNPDAGPRDRADGAGREPEGGDRRLQARHFQEPRPGAAHPFRDRQHAARRRRQVAHDGEREPVRLEDAAGRALPERIRGRACQARIRNRADPPGRAVRDRGGFPRNRRGFFHEARRDRGGDGRARPWKHCRKPASRPPRGADDPRGQARRGQGRLARDLGETGRRARLRREGARGIGDGAEPRRREGRTRPAAGGAPGGPVRVRGARGGGLGADPSLGARRGVREDRSAGRSPRLRSWRGVHRSRREGRRRSSNAKAACTTRRRWKAAGSPQTRRWPTSARPSR